jgi:hypothetical protein
MRYTGNNIEGLTQAINCPSFEQEVLDRIQGGDSHNSIEEANLHGMIENLHSEFQRKKWSINGQCCSRT